MRTFNAEQVRDAVFENDVETRKGEDRRWSRSNRTVVQMEDDKYYMLNWEEGLTEMQENSFYEQTVPEVVRMDREKVIIERTWVGVE